MLTERDLSRLYGVRSELKDVFNLAKDRVQLQMPHCDIIVTEGLRSAERQKKLVEAGASKTMKSNHLTGRAFDFAVVLNGDVNWSWPLYMKAGEIIEGAAEDLGVKIVWGGRWKTFRDGPHVELAKDWP